jgi:two-component system, response regulator
MKQHQIEILLIEDNPDEAELAIRSLKKNNLANNLVHIDDGAEAIDYIFCRGKYSEKDISIVPKVILLDLKLPKVGGLEILRQVKNDSRTKTIPVVILTSSKEDSDLIEGYSLGVNSYIVKPVNFESFAKAIAELGFYWIILNQQPPAKFDYK